MIAVVTSRGSRGHHTPQVGCGQIEPATRKTPGNSTAIPADGTPPASENGRCCHGQATAARHPQTKRENDIHDDDRWKRDDTEENDHEKMQRQRDRKIEEHEREKATDRCHEDKDDREGEDLSAKQRVAAAGEGNEALQRVVLEFAIE